MHPTNQDLINHQFPLLPLTPALSPSFPLNPPALNPISHSSSTNNIDNLKFDNHDVYVYYSGPLLKSVHSVVLKPTFQDPDRVAYNNYITPLFTNGVIDGTFQVNRLARDVLETISTVIFIGSFTTAKGILVFNYAGNIVDNTNLYVLNQDFTTFATYKGGQYQNYLNVRIQINVKYNDYRVVTISY